MKIKFSCGCGKRMVAPESKAGAKAKCPNCGKAIVVPGIERRRPAAAPPSSSRRTGLWIGIAVAGFLAIVAVIWVVVFSGSGGDSGGGAANAGESAADKRISANKVAAEAANEAAAEASRREVETLEGSLAAKLATACSHEKDDRLAEARSDFDLALAEFSILEVKVGGADLTRSFERIAAVEGVRAYAADVSALLAAGRAGLTSRIASLAERIEEKENLAKGMVRHEGRWIPREEFERAQREKGLAEYGGEWLDKDAITKKVLYEIGILHHDMAMLLSSDLGEASKAFEDPEKADAWQRRLARTQELVREFDAKATALESDLRRAYQDGSPDRIAMIGARVAALSKEIEAAGKGEDEK